MPNDETTQNPAPDPTSLPTSPQPTTEPMPEITPIFEVSVMPPEAPEATGDGVIAESNKEAPPKIEEIPLEQTGLQAGPASNPEQQANGTGATSEPLETPSAPIQVESMAQMGRNEPFGLVRSILKKAQEMIQTRKRKKLEKIMSLFITKSKITNDEVEKYLHCSDATATRYLSQLEKEGKIKQSGKTGQGVSYSKI